MLAQSQLDNKLLQENLELKKVIGQNKNNKFWKKLKTLHNAGTFSMATEIKRIKLKYQDNMQ